jgi:hypothetical protein
MLDRHFTELDLRQMLGHVVAVPPDIVANRWIATTVSEEGAGMWSWNLIPTAASLS